jgi:hypothetical protein
MRVRTDPSNVLKALAQVGLHSGGILGLGQDLQELVVRQEIEPEETLITINLLPAP